MLLDSARTWYSVLLPLFTLLIYRWISQTSLLGEESPVLVSFKRKSDFWSTLNSSFPASSRKRWMITTVWSSQVSGVNVVTLSTTATQPLKNHPGMIRFDEFRRSRGWPLIWQEDTISRGTQHGSQLAFNLPHPVPAWGKRMFVAIVLLFVPACHMFLFRLAAEASATLVERTLLIALLGLFEQSPLTSVLSDYNDKVDLSQTKKKKKKHFRSLTRRLIPPVFISFFKQVFHVMSRLELRDCI